MLIKPQQWYGCAGVQVLYETTLEGKGEQHCLSCGTADCKFPIETLFLWKNAFPIEKHLSKERLL